MGHLYYAIFEPDKSVLRMAHSTVVWPTSYIAKVHDMRTKSIDFNLVTLAYNNERTLSQGPTQICGVFVFAFFWGVGDVCKYCKLPLGLAN